MAIQWNSSLQRHWDAFVTKLEAADSVRLSTGGLLVINSQYDTPSASEVESMSKANEAQS